MLAAGTTSDSYYFVVLLHILGVIAGIGGVTLNALWGNEARKRPGPGGRAIAEASYSVGNIAMYFIYTIPVTGIALVFMSDDAWSFSQLWVWLAIVLYVVALGLSHGILRKNHRRMLELLAEMEAAGPPTAGPPPQAAELARIGQQQAPVGMVMNLLTVALVALMIWKPGV